MLARYEKYIGANKRENEKNFLVTVTVTGTTKWYYEGKRRENLQSRITGVMTLTDINSMLARKRLCIPLVFSVFKAMSLKRKTSWDFGLRDRNPPEALMSMCCECCVLSGRGICDGSFPRQDWPS